MPFSPALTGWLSDQASFVNDTFVEDAQGGRVLGPASGTLWDAYPFLHRCSYSGLFAGMSLSGLLSEDTDVRVLEYASVRGFVPVVDGPFSGDKWQEISSDQWQQIVPSAYAAATVRPPVHAMDMVLSVHDKTVDTRTWRYKEIRLSNKYVQHSWMGTGDDERLCLVVVTFGDRPEHLAPFLRPCFVSGTSSRVDPHSLYSLMT